MPTEVRLDEELPFDYLIETGSDPSARKSLSSDELEIFDRLRNPKRAAEWAAMRSVAKRLVVSRGLAADPCAVSIPTIGERPRVLLDGVLAPFQISLSHSGDYYAAAVSEEPVGIDVQIRRPIADGALHFFLSDEEQEELARLDESSALRIHYWVAKEAAFKFDHEARTYKAVTIRLLSRRGTGLELAIEGAAKGRVRTSTLPDGTVFGWTFRERMPTG